MSTRTAHIIRWASIHLTVVPFLFYQVHQFGYDKGYKTALKEAKETNTKRKQTQINDISLRDAELKR